MAGPPRIDRAGLPLRSQISERLGRPRKRGSPESAASGRDAPRAEPMTVMMHSKFAQTQQNLPEIPATPTRADGRGATAENEALHDES